MSEEKKPESPGPVVIRKGHVKPPLPGSTIEPPQEERLAPAEGVPAAPQDWRPLWQRVAEERGGQRGAGGAGRSPRSGGPGPRPGGAPRGERAGEARGDRPRGPRPERRESGEPREAASERAAATPRGEPPPAPEVAAPDEGSFADLLAGAESAPRRRFQVGEKVAGKIIQIGEDVAFLELGSGLAEAMIETVELRDAEGQLAARLGDIVDAVVVKATDRGAVVSRGHGRASRDEAREVVIEAAHTGLPVEGVVKAVNKGGLEVEVHGVRAFCPVSQIDVRFVGDPSSFVGQKLEFRVQKADQRDVVLSRRALLEEQRAARARATREQLAPGAVFEAS